MLYASRRWRQGYPSKTALPARICSQMPGGETTESGWACANEPNLGNFMVSKRQGYELSHTPPLSERQKQPIIFAGGLSDDSGTSDSRCGPGASCRQAAGTPGSRAAPSRRGNAAAEAPPERARPMGRFEYRFERRGDRRGPPGKLEEFPQG